MFPFFCVRPSCGVLFPSTTQGSYNGPPYFRASNEWNVEYYHLRHYSRSSDCAINSFRRQIHEKEHALCNR